MCPTCDCPLHLRLSARRGLQHCIVCNTPFDAEGCCLLRESTLERVRKFWLEHRTAVMPNLGGRLVPPFETRKDVLLWNSWFNGIGRRR